MNSFNLFLAFPAFQILAIVAFVAFAMRSRSSKSKKHPPGVSAWVIIRDLVLFKDKIPHRTFTRWVQTYGPIYSVRTGFSSAVVVLNSSKAARQAMIDKHSSITAKKLNTALQVLSLDKTMVALSDYGRDHRLMKKLMVTHLLGTAPQRNNANMREKMVEGLINSIYGQLDNLNGKGEAVNMSKIILDHLFPFALNQVIGREVKPLYVEELGRMVNLQDIYHLIIGDPATAALEINWREFVPFVSRWFPNKKLHAMLNEVTRRRSAVVKALIDQERELLSSGKEAKGYLDMLLKEGQFLRDEQLETAIWEPVIESTTTSHVAMVWAIFELAKHPHDQDRLFQEIEEVCGKRCVKEEDLGRLPYLKAVFYETIRRHSPLPLVPLRVVHEDVEIDGYHIPAGWQVLPNIYGANNYEGEWEKAEEWRPERQLVFGEEDDLQRTMTFGAGKRLCVGWKQAVSVASLTIARIVQNFKWAMPAGHGNDCETIVNTGTHKLNPVMAILTPRNLL